MTDGFCILAIYFKGWTRVGFACGYRNKVRFLLPNLAPVARNNDKCHLSAL
jgi:hypothetical protein